MDDILVEEEEYIPISMGVGSLNFLVSILSVLSEAREVVLQFIKFKFGTTLDGEKLCGGPELHLKENFSARKKVVAQDEKENLLIPSISFKQIQTKLNLA